MSDRDTRSRARETAEGRSVAKSLSELLGVIAGGVVVVYLIGGAVLSARLWAAEDVPPAVELRDGDPWMHYLTPA